MSKKSYMSLLKEAIAEFDTSDNVDVKGPMLDPILSWDGDGELPVYKDAASILERYYFDENKEQSIKTLDESDYENDKGSSSGEAMKDAEGAGTEQAGTSKASTIPASKDEKAKDIKKEGKDEEAEGDEEAVEEKEFNNKDVPEKKEYTDESAELEMENAIIEKLISEMEDDDADDDDDEEEVEEGKMTYTGKGPDVSMPKEKKAKGPEEDTEGAGTEQAGTGTDAGQVPDRKDRADQMVKPKKYTDENTQIEEALAALESELNEADEEAEVDAEVDKDAEADEEKDLDVDKEMTKEAASAVPGGPSPKKKGEDWEDDEAAYTEAFDIFKNAISESETEDLSEEWQAALEEDVKNIVENDEGGVSLSEAMTDRQRTFWFGAIQRAFGECAKKCGRIAISSKAATCKESCIAKRDAAIRAAREKAKAEKAKARGNDAKATKAKSAGEFHAKHA